VAEAAPDQLNLEALGTLAATHHREDEAAAVDA
jgi:hypothetical protein